MTYEDREIVLPVWHEIGLEEVLRYSPLLSDIKALSTKDGLDSIAAEILKKIEKPIKTTQMTIKEEHRERFTDVSEADVRFHITRTNSAKTEVKIEAINDLEKIAMTKRLWKHDEVWDVVDKQILVDDPLSTSTAAVYLLKRMLLSAEKEWGAVNYVSNISRERYLNKIMRILESVNSEWFYYKPDANQILRFLVQGSDRFMVWWTAWKVCAEQVMDDDDYTRSIAAFINDLGTAEPDLKNSIKPNLYDLMESAEPRLSRRAIEMHRYLFG
jgi:hypothetical protein